MLPTRIQRVLLTLGRLPKCLELARGFAANGIEVQVAEPHTRHLTGLSRAVSKSHVLPSPRYEPDRYAEQLLSLINAEQIDLVVPVSEETLHVLPALEKLPQRARAFGPNTATLLQLHDKLRFARLAASLGLSVPESHVASTEDARRLCHASATILKARASCAGDGLERLPAGTTPPAAKSNERWLIQEQISGEVHCSLSVVSCGKVLGTVAYDGPVQSGTVAVVFRRLENANFYHRFAEQIADATRYTGFLAFDFIKPETGPPVAIECNPRVTSGVHFLDSNQLAAMIIALYEDADGLESIAEHTLAAKAKPMLQQQFYPTLTEMQTRLLKRDRSWRAVLGHLFRASEVSFRWDDPLPFLLMPYAAWPIMSQALFGELSFGEAATRDIEWLTEETEPTQ